jgi:hypothetical protein
MSVHRASATAFDPDRVKHDSVRRRERGAARMRLVAQLAALALAACVPLALLIFVEVPARRAAAQDNRVLAACARVYDAQACGCALSAAAAANPVPLGLPDEPLQLAAGQLAAGALPLGVGRSEPSRVRFTTRDFVQAVQACMAPGTQTPAD